MVHIAKAHIHIQIDGCGAKIYIKEERLANLALACPLQSVSRLESRPARLRQHGAGTRIRTRNRMSEPSETGTPLRTETC